MPIYPCTNCSARLQLPDGMSGSKLRCSKCQSVIVVPVSQPAPLPIPPLPAPEVVVAEILPTPMSVPPAAMQPQFDPIPQPGGSRGGHLRKRKSPPVWVLIVIGVSGLALAGLMVAVVFFLFAPSGPSQDWRYFPDDSQSVVHIRLADLRSTSLYAEGKKQNPGMEIELEQFTLSKLGIKSQDISTVTICSTEFIENKIIVVRTTKDYTAADICTNRGIKSKTEVKIKSHTIHMFQDLSALCVVNNQLILMGGPDLLDEVLNRDGAPKLSDNFKHGFRESSFSGPVSIMSVYSARSKPGWGPKHAPSPVYSNMQLSFGWEATANGHWEFRDTKEAELLKDYIDNYPNEFAKLVGDTHFSAKYYQQGNRVYATKHHKEKDMASILRGVMSMIR
jgi:DNA-directed RNA polymerase subunit RPC12/RpoP